MARKKSKKATADLRDYPSYSIDEVARYIGVPKRTLRAWIKGYSYPTSKGPTKALPIIQPADAENNLLSFNNLVEAQVLSATRERNISTAQLRRTIEYMRNHLNEERPLLTCVFGSHGQDIFVQQLAGKKLRNPLNVTRHGQYGFRSILKKYPNRIERDATGNPTRVFPMRAGDSRRKKSIVIHPSVSAGKPALSGSGIMVEVIWRRKKAGESIGMLAKDFRLKQSEIKAAIKYYDAA
jgi:uncharacterized protein (DUF433 family)